LSALTAHLGSNEAGVSLALGPDLVFTKCVYLAVAALVHQPEQERSLATPSTPENPHGRIVASAEAGRCRVLLTNTLVRAGAD
jgi:hypothetical protein